MTGGSEPAPPRLGYVPAIDGLRAIAVLSVIAYHLWPTALPGGFAGVDVFFVISGFVVTGSIVDKRFERLSALLAYFYARRLMRIMPALAVMLLATILAGQLLIPTSWLSNAMPQTARFAFFGLGNIVLATDTDTYFGPQAAFNPFTHTWSLGVEEQFYLFFPFLIFAWRRLGDMERRQRQLRLVALLSAASLAIFLILSVAAEKFAFYLIPARFWELGVGMMLCLTLDRWRAWLAGLRAASVVGVVTLTLLGIALTSSLPFWLLTLPVLATAGLIALVCALPTAPVARMFATAPMVGIGRLSYSLYLWHWPVFVLFRWSIGLDAPGYQATALALTVILSLLSYALVERPLRSNPALRALPDKRVVGMACAAIVTAALGGMIMLAAHDRLSISVTRDHALWYADTQRPLDPARNHCRVTERKERLSGGDLTIWTPNDCSIRPGGYTVHALGDSHGMALAPNYRQFAAEQGVEVRAYFRAACPFFKLTETMASRPKCTDFYGAAFDAVHRNQRSRDIIFLPGLRLTRITNQFGPLIFADGRPDDHVTPAALAEAHRMLSRLSRGGARVVFEAPKPIYRIPAFRCVDWFTRANPICAPGFAMPRGELEQLRLPVLSAMRQLSHELPRATVWDPFPILCPQDPCVAIDRAGRPSVFDSDHLSGHGNDLVYPGLRAALLGEVSQPPIR